MASMTVVKRDHRGQPMLEYSGTLLHRQPNWVLLEARFALPDADKSYHHFRQGDRLLEWFYADRWYNVFELHHREDDHLQGWYCNITRPAVLQAERLYADDLALDLMVYPDGRTLLLDEDEFTALDLPPADREQAQAALAALLARVRSRAEMFAAIPA
ncbi:MAG: DUF402 domain-containing protein [Anaerolineae bacterium]|nr:DUF402 domain-containing protein [Anaerolineae bacterium]